MVEGERERWWWWWWCWWWETRGSGVVWCGDDVKNKTASVVGNDQICPSAVEWMMACAVVALA
jgi:hypothetical protein